MKKSFLLLLSAVAALCASACFSSTSSSSLERVAKEAVEALKKGDYDAYAATFDMSSSDQKMLAGMIEEKVGEKIKEKGGIKSYKIVETKINEDGDEAEVIAHIIYKDGSEEDIDMDFELADGKWKQVLDK